MLGLILPGVCSFCWNLTKIFWVSYFVEFVLGRFSHFNIAIAYSNSKFCGAWTPSFCEFTCNFGKTSTPQGIGSCHCQWLPMWADLKNLNLGHLTYRIRGFHKRTRLAILPLLPTVYSHIFAVFFFIYTFQGYKLYCPNQFIMAHQKQSWQHWHSCIVESLWKTVFWSTGITTP